jgi:hypothetical protein
MLRLLGGDEVMKTKHFLLPLIIGASASLVDAWLFSNLWAALGWQLAIGEWLSQVGFTTLARWFVQLWIRIPTFVMAGLLGLLIARFFGDRWILSVLACAVGFVGVSFLLLAWVVGLSSPPGFGGYVALRLQAWNAAYAVLLFFGEWLYVRRRALLIQPGA